MAVGQEEAVAALPFRFVGAGAHGMEIGDGQDIGDIERLGNVALALDFGHPHRVAANMVGAVRQALVRNTVAGVSHGSACPR